jgi:hypothetical protein
MSQNFAKIALGQNFKPQPTSSISSPANGDTYYDSTRNTFVHYLNGVWRDMQSRTDVATAASLTSAQFTASVVQSSLVRLTGSTASTVSGLTAPADAKYLIIYNQSSALVTIANQSGTEGTAANRIICPNSANLSVSAGQSVTLGYDSSQSCWVVLSTPSSASGTGSKNYLTQYIASLGSGSQNSGNGNFELGSTAGWDWCNVGTLTNGLPVGTPNFTSVSTNALYSFTITTSSTVSAGDTYTNNTQTFTVVTALAAQSGNVFFATGTGDPTASGNLSRSVGSGTSTIAYTSFTKETMSVVSSGQLSGSYSQSVAASGVTTAGLGFCSDAFYIDAEDQAKVLTWKFYYSAFSGGSNANWSGTSSNSFGVAVYDVTNSTWLGTTASFGLTQNSGVGYATGTFQTGTTTAQLRLVVYNVTATTGATTLYFDDFTVGPQTAPLGAPMTDWVSYTPTWSSSGTAPAIGNGSVFGGWRRSGKNMQVQINIVSGTTTTYGSANAYTFSLPSGYSIDGTVIESLSPSVAGTANARYTASLTFGFGSVVPNAATTTVSVANTGGNDTFWDSTLPGSWAAATANQTISLFFEVPIVGWSSNVQMSSDTDTRVVAGAFTTSSQNINNATAQIVYTTASVDTHGGYSAGTYTVPVTGYYFVSANIALNSVSLGTTSDDILSIQQNGVTVLNMMFPGTGGSSAQSRQVNGILNCKTGDTIKIFYNTAANETLNGTSVGNYLSINRLSGPSVIAATESVNMRYTDTSGGNIGITLAAYSYATKSYDSHNAYSGSTYTVPVSGKYAVKAAIYTNSVNLSTTQVLQIAIYHNGVIYANSITHGNGSSNSWNVAVADSVSCLAGDTIQIFVFSSVATTATAGSAANWLAIERIGN